MTHPSLVRVRQPAKRTIGWRLFYRAGGRRHSLFFADRKHGGARRAKAAAERFRDWPTR